jgi:lipid-A-disaccharide synthase
MGNERFADPDVPGRCERQRYAPAFRATSARRPVDTVRGMTRPRLHWVAGEPSGDLHAAGVLRALNDAGFEGDHAGYGGARMHAEGFDLRYDLAGDAVMGLFPVVKALPRILRLMKRAEEALRTERPDALVLVDYPGFNLRLAARAKALGVPVIWYVAPQVWAWGKWRLSKIARLVDRMLCILPFEPEIFRTAGIDAAYVGHPVVEREATAPRDPATAETLRRLRGDGPLIGVFPGSRGHVVDALAPEFAAAARELRSKIPAATFAIAVAQERLLERARRPFQGMAGTAFVVGRAPDVRDAADVVMTTSGTSTLEVAAALKPLVVAYRVSPVFYYLARALVTVPHVGLVNLVAGKSIVPEYVGFRSKAVEIASDLERLLKNAGDRERQRDGLKTVRARLDAKGAYATAADAIATFVARRRPRE